ncbi:MAG: methyltransferase [Lentisphaerales bacterium]|nr:methyltransferase [Lentisphaerales bacterium]
MNKIEVHINAGGKPKSLKGPEGYLFEIDHLRFYNEGIKLLLNHLPETTGKIVFPMTGNAPVIPACAAAMNPDATVLVNEMDAHDYRMMSSSVGHFGNVEMTLKGDLDIVEEGPVHVFYQIDKNADRLLAFDILERLSKVLPAGSEVYLLIAKNRQKDFVKKLNKIFSKGTIIGKTRDASLFRGLTDSEKDIWTARRKNVEVDALGAYMEMLSRPGVFGHGRVDAGGLALYDSLELSKGESLLELGCGAGLVSLLAAVRERDNQGEETNTIHMVDSSVRAIDCAKENIDNLKLTKVSCELADKYETEQKFDVFAGNPPYYANHRIAEYFIITAAKYLKESGRVYIVSKHAAEMEELMETYGFEASTSKRRGYDITLGHFKG